MLDSWCVVSGYSYRRFLGAWVPFLNFVSPEGSGSFLLWGRHVFCFDGRYCWMCGLRPPDCDLGLCSFCYGSVRGLRYRLIVEGYDRVYEPGLEEVFGDLLSRHYVVYIGAFGPLYKVGITRYDRNGSCRGFVSRLVEQGFDAAVVFDANLNIIGAQDLERDIAETFGLRDRLYFDDKVSVLHEGFDRQEFFGLVSDVADFVRGEVVWRVVFRWPRFVDFDEVFDGDFLFGEFVYRRGNITVARNCSEVLAVNLNGLVGRGLVSWEV